MNKLQMLSLVILLLHLFFISPVIAEESRNLNLASESAILIDAKSGYVIYEKASERQMYPASITKIITAIVALEDGNKEDLVLVSQNARNTGGTKVYLEEGEVVSLHKLIQGLLINSGNDAGVAIAEHMDGSVEKFAERMNSFVIEKVGISNSSFTNPHGLFNENHYTTASDMAKITQYAIENESFTEIMSTWSLPWKGESWDTTLYNHHKLMKEIPYEGVIGGKNGYVNQAGFTLVTVAERDDIKLIAVTLNARGKNKPYKDTIALFDYGFEHFDPSMVPKEETPPPKKERLELSYQPVESQVTDEVIGLVSPWIREVLQSDGKQDATRSTPKSISLFITLFFIEFILIFLFIQFKKIKVIQRHI